MIWGGLIINSPRAGRTIAKSFLSPVTVSPLDHRSLSAHPELGEE